MWRMMCRWALSTRLVRCAPWVEGAGVSEEKRQDAQILPMLVYRYAMHSTITLPLAASSRDYFIQCTLNASTP